MKRRGRSILKWACTAATVVLLVVWVGSAWWRIDALVGQNRLIAIDAGGISFTYVSAPGPYFGAGTELKWHRVRFHWWYFVDSVSGPIVPTMSVLWLPLWPFIIATAVPAGWLWYCDRSRSPGLCVNCGYDLRGANHRVCPECGVAAPGESSGTT